MNYINLTSPTTRWWGCNGKGPKIKLVLNPSSVFVLFTTQGKAVLLVVLCGFMGKFIKGYLR